MGNMKQPSPIEEIIDYSKASKDSILTSADIDKAREALALINLRKDVKGLIAITEPEFRQLCISFYKMEKKIATLTADNLQLMAQIEARGKC